MKSIKLREKKKLPQFEFDLFFFLSSLGGYGLLLQPMLRKERENRKKKQIEFNEGRKNKER